MFKTKIKDSVTVMKTVHLKNINYCQYMESMHNIHIDMYLQYLQPDTIQKLDNNMSTIKKLWQTKGVCTFG